MLSCWYELQRVIQRTNDVSFYLSLSHSVLIWRDFILWVKKCFIDVHNKDEKHEKKDLHKESFRVNFKLLFSVLAFVKSSDLLLKLFHLHTSPTQTLVFAVVFFITAWFLISECPLQPKRNSTGAKKKITKLSFSANSLNLSGSKHNFLTSAVTQTDRQRRRLRLKWKTRQTRRKLKPNKDRVWFGAGERVCRWGHEYLNLIPAGLQREHMNF